MPAELKDDSLRPPLDGVIKCDDTVGLPGKEVLLIERDGVLLVERDGVSPAAASVRRNSTHSLEKDYKFPNQYNILGQESLPHLCLVRLFQFSRFSSRRTRC